MIKTGDLWNTAYLVVNGIKIQNILLSGNNGKTSAYFIFTGTEAEQLNREFISGKAEANVTQLKLTMNHLKDLMFNKLREREKENRNGNHKKRNHKQSQKFKQHC